GLRGERWGRFRPSGTSRAHGTIRFTIRFTIHFIIRFSIRFSDSFHTPGGEMKETNPPTLPYLRPGWRGAFDLAGGKIVFQSSFMLTTVQPRCFAWSHALSSRPTSDSRSSAYSRSESVWWPSS